MGRLLRQGKRVRYAFIQTEKAFGDVTWMCERVGVSASGYYEWCKRLPSRCAKCIQLHVSLAVELEPRSLTSRRSVGFGPIDLIARR